MDTIIDKYMDKLRSWIPDWFTPTVTLLYLCSMLIIFPYFNTEKMFHLFLDKRDYFLVTSIVYLCVMLPRILIALYDWGNDMYAPKKPDIIFALVLLAAFAISTVYSRDIRMTFFEMTSRTISGLCFLVILAIFFTIRQSGRLDKFLLWGWIAGSSALYICGILCACGINFLYLQDGLTSKQLPVYLTPMSNTNYNTCYVCLMLPPIMVLYMLCKEELTQKICKYNIYLGFLFTFFIKTESAIIAIIFGIFLLGYFALESEEWAVRYSQIVGSYLGAKVTIRVLMLLLGDDVYPFHGLSALLLNYVVLLVEILCYAAFQRAWKKNANVIREKMLSVRKLLVIIAAAAAGLCIAGLVIININARNISKRSFLYQFVLTNSTFSGRGYVWLRTMDTIKDEPILRKLFGNGLNSFRMVTQEMGKIPVGNEFADPHNEILQMMMDKGVLGLVGYYGMLISTLVRGLRSWKNNAFYLMSVMTVSIYLLQSLANEYSIYTLPFLFIFLALVNGKSIDECPQAGVWKK